MNIFKRDDEIETYTYPVTKILVCIVLFIIVGNWDKIIPVSNEIGELVGLIFDCVVMIGGISCILNSFSEIWTLHMRRTGKTDDAELLEGLITEESTEESTEEEDKLYVKKGIIGFIVGMVLGVAAVVILCSGLFVTAKSDDKDIIIFLGAAGLCMIVSIILLLKSLPALLMYEGMRVNKKYDKEKLYELPSMHKSNVKTKLLADGFEFKDGYYRKKKFSFLKGSATYFFKMADCMNMEDTIDRELDRFDVMEKGQGNNCLCLLLYLEHMDEEAETFMKELGKTSILIDGSIGPYVGMTSMVVAVDKETETGYFLDIGKGFEISSYSELCKLLKKILE